MKKLLALVCLSVSTLHTQDICIQSKTGSLTVPPSLLKAETLNILQTAPVQQELKKLSRTCCQRFLGLLSRIETTENYKQPFFRTFFQAQSQPVSLTMFNLLASFKGTIPEEFRTELIDHYLHARNVQNLTLTDYSSEWSENIRQRHKLLTERWVASQQLHSLKMWLTSDNSSMEQENDTDFFEKNNTQYISKLLEHDCILYLKNAHSHYVSPQAIWKHCFKKSFIRERMQANAFFIDEQNRLVLNVPWDDEVIAVLPKLLFQLKSSGDASEIRKQLPQHATAQFFKNLAKHIANFTLSDKALKTLAQEISTYQKKFSYRLIPFIQDELTTSITAAVEAESVKALTERLIKQHERWGTVPETLKGIYLYEALSASKQASTIAKVLSQNEPYYVLNNEELVLDEQTLKDLNIACGPPSDHARSMINDLVRNHCHLAISRTICAHEIVQLSHNIDSLKAQQQKIKDLHAFFESPCNIDGHKTWLDYFDHLFKELHEYENDILKLDNNTFEGYLQANTSLNINQTPILGPVLVSLSRYQEDLSVVISIAAQHVKQIIPLPSQFFNDDSEILDYIKPVFTCLGKYAEGIKWTLQSAAQLPRYKTTKTTDSGEKNVKEYLLGCIGLDPCISNTLDSASLATSVAERIEYTFVLRFIMFQNITNVQRYIKHLEAFTQAYKLIPAAIKPHFQSLNDAFIETNSKLQHTFSENDLQSWLSQHKKQLCDKFPSMKNTVDGALKDLSIICSGSILPQYARIQSAKNELLQTLIAVSECEYQQIPIKLIKQWNTQKMPWCYADYYAHLKHPKLVLEDCWNPTLKASAITNDLILGTENAPHNLVITGPNARGKSTYMRAIIFNMMLAQKFGIACAKKCECTPFFHIAAYLNIQDDPAKNRSLFQANVYRSQELFDIAQQTTAAQNYSLIVFDELFNGTNARTGEALAYGMLESVSEFPLSMCISSTHYQFSEELRHALPNTFSFSRLGDGENNYRVLPGIYKDSNAFEEAATCGLADNVLISAQRYLRKASKNMFFKRRLKQPSHYWFNSPNNHEPEWYAPYRIWALAVIEKLKGLLLNECDKAYIDKITRKIKQAIVHPAQVYQLRIRSKTYDTVLGTMLSDEQKSELKRISEINTEPQWKTLIGTFAKEIESVSKRQEAAYGERDRAAKQQERMDLCSAVAQAADPHAILSMTVKQGSNNLLLAQSYLVHSIDEAPGKTLKDALCVYDEHLYATYFEMLQRYKDKYLHLRTDALFVRENEQFISASNALLSFDLAEILEKGLIRYMPKTLRTMFSSIIFNCFDTIGYIQHTTNKCTTDHIRPLLPEPYQFQPSIVLYLAAMNEIHFLNAFKYNDASRLFASDELVLLEHIIQNRPQAELIHTLMQLFGIMQAKKDTRDFWGTIVEEKAFPYLWLKFMYMNVQWYNANIDRLDQKFEQEHSVVNALTTPHGERYRLSVHINALYNAIQKQYCERYRLLVHIYNNYIQPHYHCERIRETI